MNPQLIIVLRKVTLTTVNIATTFAISAALRKAVKTHLELDSADDIIDNLLDVEEDETVDVRAEVISAAKLIGVAVTISIVSAILASIATNALDNVVFGNMELEA